MAAPDFKNERHNDTRRHGAVRPLTNTSGVTGPTYGPLGGACARTPPTKWAARLFIAFGESTGTCGGFEMIFTGLMSGTTTSYPPLRIIVTAHSCSGRSA